MTFRSDSNLSGGCWPRPRAGFTLVEMVVSMAVSTVLVIGLASVLSIGLKAASPNPSTEAKRQAAEVADQITSELAGARSFGLVGSSDIEFTVPSRNGQNATDSIRYQWQGILDKRLLRSINSEPFHLVAEQVNRLQFSYVVNKVSASKAPISEGAEDLLSGHDSKSLLLNDTFNASTSNWIAQRFKPVVHPEAVAWKVTRVSFYIRRNTGSNGQFNIRIHAIDPVSGKPDSDELDSITVKTDTLPLDFQWVEFEFPDSVELQPCTSYALIIAPFGPPSTLPRVEFQRSLDSPILTGAFRMTTSNAGSNWTPPDALTCVRFQVYGKVKTQTWK